MVNAARAGAGVDRRHRAITGKTGRCVVTPNHHPKLTLTVQVAGLPGAGTPVSALPGKANPSMTRRSESMRDAEPLGLHLADALRSIADEVESAAAARWRGGVAASAGPEREGRAYSPGPTAKPDHAEPSQPRACPQAASEAAGGPVPKGKRNWTRKATALIVETAVTAGYVVTRYCVSTDGSSVYLKLDHPDRAWWAVRVSDHAPRPGEWSRSQASKRKMISVRRPRALSHFVDVLRGASVAESCRSAAPSPASGLAGQWTAARPGMGGSLITSPPQQAIVSSTEES
jgi:hypothetical protein